jgi:subtilisin family serine protease
MYMLTASKKRLQLARLDTEVVEDRATRAIAVAVNANPKRDTVNTSGLVARASRAFFGIGGDVEGKALAEMEALQGPPPVAFRETTTGLVRLVYREVVIRFKYGVAKKTRDNILNERGFKIRRENPFIAEQVIVYDPERKHAGEQLVELANKWSELDDVVFAAPNFVSQYRRHASPKIPAAQWHLHNLGNGGKKDEDVKALEAWKISQGKPSIVVAVLDDGVDVEHPNLKSNIWKNPDATSKDTLGRDFFVPPDHPEHFNPRPKLFQFPYDRMAGNDIHGTCCAGVVAAVGSHGGAFGAAPKCRILPVKVFHADSLAQDEYVANAIRYAALNADILSCSWSGGLSPDVEMALQDIGQTGRGGKGTAVFCAAGNDYRQPVSFPASDPNAIAVGASTDEAKIAGYSNIGPEIAFVAPSSGGVNGIYTTDVSYPGRGFNIGVAENGGVDGLHTNSFGGTSSATPLAAGIAALVLSVSPNLNRDELRKLMENSTDKIGDPGSYTNGHSDEFGHGRLNAGKAVQAAKGVAKSAGK